MTDPIALTHYDPFGLPKTGDCERAHKFYTRGQERSPGFGDVWIAHAEKRDELLQFSAVDYFARQILAAYDRGRWGFFDISRAMAPGQTQIAVTSEVMADASVVQDSTLAELRSRRLALVTLVDYLALRQKRLTKDLMRALARALEVQPRIAKREVAIRAARMEGDLIADGKTVRETVATISIILSLAERKVWALRSSPHYQLRRDIAKALRSGARPEAGWSRTHAAEAWFAGIDREHFLQQADRIAQKIAARLKAGTRKSKSGKRARLGSAIPRWDLFNLFEMVNGRGHPPTECMRVALDLALGLVDANNFVTPAALGGVADRDTFMVVARTEAGFADRPTDAELMDKLDSSGAKLLDPDQIMKLRRTPLYQTAVEVTRASS